MSNALYKTPEGRTSFMKIFKPEMNFNETGKEYSLRLLIPKSENLSDLKDLWNGLAEEVFDRKDIKRLRPLFSSGDPFEDKGAIVDGDWKYENVDDDKKGTYEAYKGCWVLTAKCQDKFPPAIVDAHKQEIMSEADFASGDYAIIVIEISGYLNKKLKSPQMSVRLKAVQKTREGERFSGGSSSGAALDMFDDQDDMGGLL